MNAHARIIEAALLIAVAAASAPAMAAETAAPVRIAMDCAHPSLPSQREVGELTGQHNLAQVYATRARLMAEARRACQRNGTARVVLVREPVQASESDAARRVAGDPASVK